MAKDAFLLVDGERLRRLSLLQSKRVIVVLNRVPKAAAVGLLGGSNQPRKPPIAKAEPVAPPDLMIPVIQAEIARQVALALQKDRERTAFREPQPANVIRFPVAG